jgi:DNA-nicking Smr family endonuclease
MSPVGRARDSGDGEPWDDSEEPLVPEVDLHGKRPEEALRHLARELHSARQRRLSVVLVITGQGLGNALHKPILRGKVEAWLTGPEGLRLGVQGFERTSRGGALLVRLAGSAASG